MSRMSALLAVAALAAPLVAEDFGPVVKTVALIYQGKTHFGVACNFSNNRDRVADLQRALPEGSTLTVVDVKHPMQVGPAASAMRQRGVTPSAELVPLQFRMPPEFVRAFKQAALDHDMKLNELLNACFQEFMKK